MFEMTSNEKTLRIMFAINLLGGGVPGAVMILAPTWALSNMFAGTHDPAIFGMTGAIWFAIGIVSILGLFQPNQMKSVFILQMIYKSIWVSAVAIPLMLAGNMTVLPMAIFFVLVVLGWGYGLFGRRSEAEPAVSAA
ncbi:MAG: hypothetical protein AAF902_05670 [Chloroflexota bacterium]